MVGDYLEHSFKVFPSNNLVEESGEQMMEDLSSSNILQLSFKYKNLKKTDIPG